MALVDDLRTTRDQIMANLLAESASPKPSYSIDGESVDWNGWAKTQQDRIEQLTRTINALSPYIVITRMTL